ncbi:MAG: DUF3788 domain-containing protein [Methanomassiliicoccaceae archaeon]|jgi:hypothetical protein|nr:DUF3788 domain-containing protein [Methanomassiliicoccaceae archaeon]
MSLSAFSDKTVRPDETAVAAVLDKRKSLWDALKEHITKDHKNVSEEWKFYTKEAGWTLVVKSGKRTLLYLIPMNGLFKVNFVFGERAVSASQDAGLPEYVMELISNAAPYVEGRSFMFDVNEDADVETAIKLLRVKDQN